MMKKATLSSKRLRNFGHGGVVMHQYGKAVGRKRIEKEISRNQALADLNQGVFYLPSLLQDDDVHHKNP